jgi:hypothetical protein
MYKRPHGENDSLRRSDGRDAERLSFRVVKGGVEETGDHVHAAGLDLAARSWITRSVCAVVSVYARLAVFCAHIRLVVGKH